MIRLKNMRHMWPSDWPPESPIRDYVWGAFIVAFGVFTVFGMFFLFGG